MRTKKVTTKGSRKPKTLKKLAAVKPAQIPTIEKKPSLGWVALELSSRGETEKDINALLSIIRRTIGASNDVEIFVPIYFEDEEYFEKNVTLLSGYFFIRHDSSLSYHKLKDSKYFDGVVCNPLTKAVEIVPDAQVQELKAKFDGLMKDASKVRPGQTVRILDGLYKGLVGELVKVLKRDQMCIIKITSLKSRKITVSAPLMSVAVVDEGEGSTSVTFF
jgi:transcription antitermination factor NusG